MLRQSPAAVVLAAIDAASAIWDGGDGAFGSGPAARRATVERAILAIKSGRCGAKAAAPPAAKAARKAHRVTRIARFPFRFFRLEIGPSRRVLWLSETEGSVE